MVWCFGEKIIPEMIRLRFSHNASPLVVAFRYSASSSFCQGFTFLFIGVRIGGIIGRAEAQVSRILLLDKLLLIREKIKWSMFDKSKRQYRSHCCSRAKTVHSPTGEILQVA